MCEFLQSLFFLYYYTLFFAQFIQLQLDPATGGSLPAYSNNSVTQVIRLTNNMHGQVPVVFCAHLQMFHHLRIVRDAVSLISEVCFCILILTGFAESFGDEVESKLQGKWTKCVGPRAS